MSLDSNGDVRKLDSVLQLMWPAFKSSTKMVPLGRQNSDKSSEMSKLSVAEEESRGSADSIENNWRV